MLWDLISIIEWGIKTENLDSNSEYRSIETVKLARLRLLASNIVNNEKKKVINGALNMPDYSWSIILKLDFEEEVGIWVTWNH